MRKRYHSFSRHDTVKKANPTHAKEPIRPKVKKRRIWLFCSVALLVVLGVLVWYLGSSALSSANNMFSSNISFRDVISKSALKQTNGRTNIIFLGKGGENHDGGQLTDTMLVATIDQKTKKTAIISVPRDLRVNIPGHGTGKLNSAYANGYMDEKNKDKKADAGAQMTSKVFEAIIGLPIHYYVSVDFLGFKELVDTLGSVTVNVEKDLTDTRYPKDSFTKDGKFVETDAYMTFTVKAGRQTMDGTTALRYARSRESTSDFDRSHRQQKIIFAIKEKAFSLGVLANPVKLSNMMQNLGNHVKTNLSPSELKELVGIAEKLNQSDIINKVIDNSSGGYLVSASGSSDLLPKGGNFSEIQAMIKNVFDENQVALEEIEIEVLNGSGVTGLGGQIADQLKADGLTIIKIENNPTKVDETTIYTGLSSSKALTKVKAKFDSPKIVALDDKGLIRVIIGRDYGK